MKDIITIIMRLTISCIMAGAVMGVTFILTSDAKKQNEYKNEQKVSYSLLGYDVAKEIPEAVKLHEVFRYVVTTGDDLSVGYLVPAGHSSEHGDFTFIGISLDGVFTGQYPVDIGHDKVRELEDRDAAITAALGPGKEVRYADQTTIVTENDVRTAYLLPGKFPGFKTFISVMLALDPTFTILGLEIMEHEEDPGLGAEIKEKYFKNQFIGKSFNSLKNLGVDKIPLPAEYTRALEGKISKEEVRLVQDTYKDKNIYALTGATISSRSVTNGVKGIAKKFAYRISILNTVIEEQHIAVPF
jgi:electron transport complex protein RnfG